MAIPPARTELSDDYPLPSNATMRTGMGKLWDYVTELLGPTGDAVDALVALGAASATPSSDFAWHTKAIGELFYLRDDIVGVSAPPTDNENYRYIKLTAADAYNTGVLTSESVSGSAPLVVATAVINLSGSPINGKTINLINTERRYVRAGSSGTLQDDAFQGHRMAAIGTGLISVPGSFAGPGAGAYMGPQPTTGDPTTDGTNGTPRTANETRVKSIGATAYMRIK